MTSPNLRADIFDPKTLAAMDQAFAAVWRMLRANDPFRDYASDAELRTAIGYGGYRPYGYRPHGYGVARGIARRISAEESSGSETPKH